MKRRSAANVLWGVTLIVLGGLFLARNLGYPIPVWSAIVRYWPVLIIAWGLLKLVDYYRFKDTADNRPLFSGGEAVLLIFLIFVGTAITTAANISPGIARIIEFDGDFDLWDITGNNFEFTEHIEMDAAPGAAIEITNRFGAVDVRPADVDRIIVDVQKTVRAANQEEASRIAPQFVFSIENDGSTFRIASNRDSGSASNSPAPGVVLVSRERFKSDLRVRVPRSSSVKIENRNGPVQIEDVAGDHVITNRFSPVTIRRVMGTVQVENRNGSVAVEDVSSAVKINNSFDSTTVANVGGAVEITSRNGPVTVRNVRESVSVTNAFDRVEVRDVRGMLAVSGRNSEIDVRFSEPPVSDVLLTTEFSDVRLELPAGSAFGLDARTRFGSLSSSFREIQVTSESREEFTSSRVGEGGPEIRIETRNGDIDIARRGG